MSLLIEQDRSGYHTRLPTLADVKDTERVRRLQNTLIGILQQRPMSVAEWMQYLLHSPDGYYANRGIRKDFYTPSELFPGIADCYESHVRSVWDQLGRPSFFPIYELGPGNGTFAAAFLTVASKDHDFHKAVEYHLVEQSPLLVKRQKQLLQQLPSSLSKVTWHEADLTNFPFPHLSTGAVISFELHDSLPHRVVVKRKGKLMEVFICIRNNQIEEIEGSPEEETSKYLAKYPEWVDSLPEGRQIPQNIPGLKLQEKLAQQLHNGTIVTVDYGYQLPYVPRNPFRWMSECEQVYYGDNFLPLWIILAGLADNSCLVDFSLLGLPTGRAGFSQVLVEQRNFLERFGIKDTVTRYARELVARNTANQQRDSNSLQLFFKNIDNLLRAAPDWLVFTETKGVNAILPRYPYFPNDWHCDLAANYIGSPI